jgi:hypothetical protein
MQAGKAGTAGQAGNLETAVAVHPETRHLEPDTCTFLIDSAND